MTDSLHRAMGFYGLRDGRVAVFAVHPAADPALPGDVRAALRREYGRLGWIAPRALAACPPAEQLYYDQVAQVVMPSWSRGRVTLLGDAAYAVSLLAGQGAALAGYEQMLRPVVLDKQDTARKGVRWFVPSTRSQLWLRRAAFAAARLPVADRLLAATLVGKPTTIIADLAGRRAAPTLITDHKA